ncbi:MAG: tRNA threonylcarbamoyladenosine dehydratase [Clostridia bacterium]|nr:tRNA threonylcarbamoyladenosine dehydratase [Clostridia bacterium]
MTEWLMRTEMALEGAENLKEKTVAIVGLGGVGGYVCEAVARSGVGTIIAVDRDTVSLSNINRQIIATTETVGKSKAQLWAERIKSINPNCNVIPLDLFYLPDTREELFKYSIDYVVDAVDTVTAKVDLIVEAKNREIPVISSMGFGNKLDCSKIRICDIYETSGCPLARVMRREMKKRNISDLKVCFSDEEPLNPLFEDPDSVGQRKKSPASVAWIPSAAGLFIAGEVIKDLCKKRF